MKNTFLIIFFALLITNAVLASTGKIIPPPDFAKYLYEFDDCDACGCSASGGGMGFSSMVNQNFVGVRYFYQSYSSRDGIFANSPWVDENFNTIQLWARIPFTKTSKYRRRCLTILITGIFLQVSNK